MVEYFVAQCCPVCGSSESKVLYSGIKHTCNVLEKAGVKLENKDILTYALKCKYCKHIYLSLTLKDDLLSYYYNVVESEYYDSQKVHPKDHRPADTKKFAKFIENESKSGDNILEIGSGLGFLLKELKIAGFKTYGIEPSGFASSFSRNELKLDVITGMLTEKTYKNKKFDVIILSDVIEHISDPNQLFKLIEYYLTDTGKVIVLTGNSRSLYAKICGKKWLYFYSWEHMSFFNRRSIEFLLNKNSLKLSYYKNTAHSGSFYVNSILFFKTIVMIILEKLKIRKYNFYLMAFDHFIAVGKKTLQK